MHYLQCVCVALPSPVRSSELHICLLGNDVPPPAHSIIRQLPVSTAEPYTSVYLPRAKKIKLCQLYFLFPTSLASCSLSFSSSLDMSTREPAESQKVNSGIRSHKKCACVCVCVCVCVLVVLFINTKMTRVLEMNPNSKCVVKPKPCAKSD